MSKNHLIQHFESGGSVYTPTDPATYADRKPSQSLEQFLAKYSRWIDKNGNFAGDRANGSNGIGDDAYTASNGIQNELNGQNARQYYLDHIGFQRGAPGVDGDVGTPDTFNDALDINYHHNKSGYQWDQIRPFVGAAAAMLTAGATLAPGAAAGSTAVATPGAATGLAGKLGMSAGLGANAVNAGALNAAMTGVRGGNIGDMARAGLTGAAMSPVATLAGGAAASAMPSTWNPNLVKGLASVAGNAASGGAGAALTGGNVATGIRNGAVNGAVGALGSYIGNMAKTNTADLGKGTSNFLGSSANGIAQAALRGNLSGNTLANLVSSGAGQYVGDETTDATGSADMGSIANILAKSSLKGKPLSVQQAVAQILQGKINGTVNGALTNVFNGPKKG